MDIDTHNKALLMKNLHNFFNKKNLPWVKLIWEEYYSYSPPMDKLEGSFYWNIQLMHTYKKYASCTFVYEKYNPVLVLSMERGPSNLEIS